MPEKPIVQYSKIEIQKVINELSNVVVSLNNIGSSSESLPENEWKNAVIDYLVENDTLDKLSNCRYVLDCGVSDEKVEELPDSFGEESSFWSYKEYVARKGI